MSRTIKLGIWRVVESLEYENHLSPNFLDRTDRSVSIEHWICGGLFEEDRHSRREDFRCLTDSCTTSTGLVQQWTVTTRSMSTVTVRCRLADHS